MKYWLEGKLLGANDYVNLCRANRFGAGAKKKEIDEGLMWQFKAPRARPIEEPCRIRFTWHEKSKRRDLDNIAFGKKFVLDAMQSVGMLPNDNQHWVKGFSDEFVFGKKNGVEVEIMYE